MQLNLKIVSDGTQQGTKVYDKDTGQYITNIVKIKWEFGLNDFHPLITFTVSGDSLEFEFEGPITT